MVWSGSWVAERLGIELVGRDGPADGPADTAATAEPGRRDPRDPRSARDPRGAQDPRGRRSTQDPQDPQERRGPRGSDGGAGSDRLKELLGLAVRRNPKRAHLLVSNVLGKHVPQDPRVVLRHGYELGLRVRALLGDDEARRSVVLGYAETATGLGHCVADGVALARYLHSTRRPVAGVVGAGGFEEAHSHATSHLLLPEDPELLTGDGPLVLVDDEFSTGNTVLNTIRALHRRAPRTRYVIVALVDMRSPEDRDRLARFADEIGARVDLLAAATGTVRLPDGVLEAGLALVARHGSEPAADGSVPVSGGDGSAPGGSVPVSGGSVPDSGGDGSAPGGSTPVSGGSVPVPGGSAAARPRLRPDGVRTRTGVVRVGLGWPEGVPDGGRHGFTPAHRTALTAALPAMAQRLADAVHDVLGDVGVHDALGDAGGDASRGAGRDSQRATGGDAPRDAGGGAPQEAPGARGGSRPGRPGSRRPRVLVLGFEELMYAPLRLAVALCERTHADVRFSTTTRSPVLAVDDPGYAIRSRLVFPAHDDPDDGPGERYAYNVAGAGFDAVLAVVDSVADTPALHAPDGLLAALARHVPHVLLAVVPSYAPAPAPAARTADTTAPASRAAAVPPSAEGRAAEGGAAEGRAASPWLLPGPLRGPDFSSYAPDEVGWLLQDLSGVRLEAPTEEREEAIQHGGAHYAESLPVEYQPDDEYRRLFHTALDASAGRIARAVGTVTELVLGAAAAGRARGRGGERRPVLVSLARAGTPVGILMRRWADRMHGLRLPHYTVSIVRGRGIDGNALRWLAGRHDPADVVFVDGWTGKGAIARELAEALAAFERTDGVTFAPDLAVLADPGRCVRTYGTREDFLIPSACLNSTVSGLVSRTVLRADLVGPADFHGAKFYRELAGADVSGTFLDTVSARFEESADAVQARVGELLRADRTPTWEGWAAVERISETYGIRDVNLVKPGVGETTRVLLRRVPWKVLARGGAGADLAHVRLLAARRGVPVEEVDDLPYSCVGLIHPRFTRGATGADGRTVTGS